MRPDRREGPRPAGAWLVEGMAACGKHELGAAAVGVDGLAVPAAFPRSIVSHLWKSQGGGAADGLVVFRLLTWGFYDPSLFLFFLTSTSLQRVASIHTSEQPVLFFSSLGAW